ncbi:MAG: hypothetical protein AAFN04_11070 [Pseudomonadota bacterium]
MNIGVKVGFGFLAYWLLRLAGVPLETFIALIIAFLIGYPIGWILASRISDETDVDSSQFRVIGWANLLAWIFPIAGVAVAELTSGIAKESIKSRFFYGVTSWVGYGLVVTSVVLSVPLLMAEGDQPDRLDTVEAFSETNRTSSGERSFARCPYAARERWSQVEIEVYCNREPSQEDLREFNREQQRLLAAQN